MDLVNPKAEKYAEKFSDPLSPALKKIAEDTYANHSHSNMLSGHLQGLYLKMMSKLIQPKYILEIGTFTGFSAICLAEGLANDGKLVSLEIREEDALLSRQNIAAAGFEDKIEVIAGNALELIPGLNYDWDLVFIDADKPGYIKYYEMLVPVLKPGALIMADNVLFHGQVLEDTIKGKNPEAIHAFNEHVSKDQRVEKMMLTLRDGLLLILKK